VAFVPFNFSEALICSEFAPCAASPKKSSGAFTLGAPTAPQNNKPAKDAPIIVSSNYFRRPPEYVGVDVFQPRIDHEIGDSRSPPQPLGDLQRRENIRAESVEASR
jgi:hypothetical protein